jgi:hypothetical protein
MMCEISFKAAATWSWTRSNGPHVMEKLFGRNNTVDAGSDILTV